MRLACVFLGFVLLGFVLIPALGCGGSSGAPLPSPPPSKELVADAGTVALWHFNEGTGQVAADSSGNGLDLQLGSTSGPDLNDPEWISTGRFGACLEYTSADVDRAGNGLGNLFPGNVCSVELWYRTTVKDGPVFEAGGLTCTIAWANNGTLFFFAVGDGFNWTRCEINDPTLLNTIADGNWHYIAGTWDGTTERLYIDGVEEATRVPVATTLGNASFHRAGGTDFDGQIDEIRLSDVVRTPQEILDHYTAATSP